MSDRPQPNGRPAHPTLAGSGLTFEPRWEKPLVPVGGGPATLLIRVLPAPVPDPAAAPAGGRRAPLDVAFALDRSGSMGGDKLTLVKEAVDVAVRLLREEDRVALTVYDHAVTTLQPLAPASTRTKTALRLALHGVDAGGSTALADGWLTACRELAEAAPPAVDGGPTGGAGVRIRRALLLTDGLANVGLTDPVALTEHAHQLRQRGVGTTTLGVGLDFDEELLAGLAEAGGGTFRWIGAAKELRAFFEREIGELLTIAAGDLTLTLTLPAGVDARVVSAYPAERDGARLKVALGDLPAGEEIPLLVALDLAPGTPGASHRIGLEATWADPAADARRRATIDVPPLAYADAATVEATAADPLVQELAALQGAAAAQREAIRLDRAGHRVASRSVLYRAQAMLQAAPASPTVQAFAQENSALLAYDAAAPLPEEARKRATSGSHLTARGRRRDEA